MIQNMSQAVLLLILANVLFSMKGFGDQIFFEKFKFQINNILKGEKIRMISSGFLHVDWMHLGFNMYALYLFGDIVDAKLGTIGFLVIYFGSLLAGSLYSLNIIKKNFIIVLLGHQVLFLELYILVLCCSQKCN